MSENKKDKKNDQLFEHEFYKALNFYGYLLPNNSNDIERFEELYGKTEIDTPSLIELPKTKSEKSIPLLGEMNFDLSLGVAAFTSNENDSFHIPDDLVKNIKQEKKKSIKNNKGVDSNKNSK